MLHKFISKVRKLQLITPMHFSTVVKKDDFSFGGNGLKGIQLPMLNRVKGVRSKSAIMVLEIKFGTKILPAYNPLDIKVK